MYLYTYIDVYIYIHVYVHVYTYVHLVIYSMYGSVRFSAQSCWQYIYIQYESVSQPGTIRTAWAKSWRDRHSMS